MEKIKYIRPGLIPLTGTYSFKCDNGLNVSGNACHAGLGASRNMIMAYGSSCALGWSERGSCTLGGQGKYSVEFSSFNKEAFESHTPADIFAVNDISRPVGGCLNGSNGK
jgi:hypothetical protein